ncbi:kinase-like domain-containing protein [Mycena sp. CBHHK59/15]|nr:kinase-like domain-containing protein [Mycena sp. CBHHK59/15]
MSMYVTNHPIFLWHRHIYSVIGDGSAAYTELERLPHISWIENNEVIRSRFVQLLSPSNKRRIREWRRHVLTFAKAFSSNLKRRRSIPMEDFQKKAQICIDVVHEMITILRDSSQDAMFEEDSLFLMALCQRATLLPHLFTHPSEVELSEGTSFDAGASATVSRGLLGPKEVAVKTFRLYYRTVNRIKKRFIKEAIIMQLFHHPNVLRFVSVLNEPNKICIVTPWYRNGHIMKHIAGTPDAPLKELMEQVADGLHFISQYGIVHGDLKGANILIDDEEKAVVADFGLSFIQESDPAEAPEPAKIDPFVLRILRAQCAEALRAGRLSQSDQSISTLAATILSTASASGGGTWQWMAPERLSPSAYGNPTARATKKSDVYAFGMLVIEVFTGGPPWKSGLSQCSILLNVVTGCRPPRPPNVSDELWEIVEQCWAHQPVERPTMWDIYNRLACIP